MQLALELVVAACLIGGTFFTFLASLGLVRLPDVYCRMHAAGKAGTLGVALMILAVVGWTLPDGLGTPIWGVAAIVFQFFTTPAATHLLCRAVYLTEYPMSDRTVVDELRGFFPAHPFSTRGRE